MRKTAIATIVVLLSNSAFAAASGSIVFDPTNFAKNALTAAATVKTEISTAMTQLNTFYQLRETLRQAQAIGRGDLQAIGAITNQEELFRLIKESQETVTSLKKLDVNLGNIQGRYDYLMNISSRYGVSLETYIAQRDKKAREGVKAAQLERDRDLNTLKDTDKTIEEVKKLAKRDLTTNYAQYETMNESLALLNTSIAKILQNSTLQNMRNTDEAHAKDAKDKADENGAIASLKYRAKTASDAAAESERAINEAVGSLPGRN